MSVPPTSSAIIRDSHRRIPLREFTEEHVQPTGKTCVSPVIEVEERFCTLSTGSPCVRRKLHFHPSTSASAVQTDTYLVCSIFPAQLLIRQGMGQGPCTRVIIVIVMHMFGSPVQKNTTCTRESVCNVNTGAETTAEQTLAQIPKHHARIFGTSRPTDVGLKQILNTSV